MMFMNELCFADEEMEAGLEQLTEGTIPLKFRFNFGVLLELAQERL